MFEVFTTHGPLFVGHGPGVHILFFFVPLLVLLLAVVLLAVFGRRWSRRADERREVMRQHWQADGNGGAERVLAERFARGDIEEVEYRARLEVLRASNPRRAV